MIKAQLVTFYSYKGGVGRTMACANAAVQLARQHGRHVILIDWDLDAPGLHYYFGWTDEELADQPGLIDYLEDFRAQVREGEQGWEPDLDRYLLDLKPRMAHRLTQGSVRLMTCGRTDGAYMKRVQDFDWDAFYLKDEGFEIVEALKYRLREKADLALIDARAGQADIGATPTIQVPDLVVLLFATNRQNLHGTAEIARRLYLHPDRRRFGLDPLRMMMVPSRVLGSATAYDRWLAEEAEPVYDRLVEDGVLSRADQPRGLLQCAIPVDAHHALGESLPVLTGRSGRSRLERAYADLAGAIDNLHQGLPPWPEDIVRFEKEVIQRRTAASKRRPASEGKIQVPAGMREAALPLDTDAITDLIRSAESAIAAYRYSEAKTQAELALVKAKETGFSDLQARSHRTVGNILQRLLEHDAANFHYHEAITLYRKVGDILGEALCIENLGDIALRRSEHQTARERYEQALPLYRQIGSVQGEANCIMSLGDIALYRSDREAAHERYEQALPLYRQISDMLGQANCIKSLGDIALRRSDHEAARERYEQALPLYRQIGSVQGEANCIRSLGDIALYRSDHAVALERYEQALPLYRQISDMLGQANCIMRLGDIALHRSDHEAARERYEQALPLYRKVGDIFGAANCIRSLGDIALHRSDHEAAGEHYERALPLYRKVGDILGEANCIRSLGDIALYHSDHEAARERYEQTLTLYRQIGSVQGEANCIKSLGDIAYANLNSHEARERYETALFLYSQIPDPYSMGRVHLSLAETVPEGTERSAHVAAARSLWRSIDRDDLIAYLDTRFGPP